MISLDNLVTVEQTANPQVIRHYNLFRSAARGRPGTVPAKAAPPWKRWQRSFFSTALTFEWSGLSLEEIDSGGKALILFALGLVVVYVTLATQI